MKFKLKSFLFILFLVAIFFISSFSSDIIIPEKYGEVLAGERLFFFTSLKYPESTGRQDVNLKYEVKDDRGKLVAFFISKKELEVQADFSDYIVIPKNTPTGIYFLNATIDIEGKDIFEVGESFSVISPEENTIFFYFAIIFSSIFFLGILVSVNIFLILKKRKRRGK